MRAANQLTQTGIEELSYPKLMQGSDLVTSLTPSQPIVRIYQHLHLSLGLDCVANAKKLQEGTLLALIVGIFERFAEAWE